MSTARAEGEAPATMKALRAHQRGGAEQLSYEDAPAPVLSSGSEVLVEVHAAAITFDELTWPETWERGGHDRTPIVPSHEFSGVVRALGTEVSGFASGDPVFGLVPFDRDGAAAELVVVPASHLASKPASVPHPVAAAAVLPALTAMEALDEQLALHAGQRLLVRGGTGAVAAAVIQLAAHAGVAVTATVRNAAGAAYATGLGAAAVLVGDETSAIDAGTFDAAIDAVGAGTPEWLYRAVRAGGRLVTLQEPPQRELAERYGIDARFFVVSARPENLARLGGLLAAGEFDVAIADSYPLADGRAAYASRGATGRPGKTVITVAQP